jgi:hypothetical protein
LGRGRTNANGRANANAGLNNAAARANANANVNNQGFVNQTPFFSDPGVRRQLNMNDNQFNTLNRAYQNAYARYNQALSNLNPNLTEEQRTMELQRLQSQFNQNLSGTANTTFTDPQGRSRFNQLNRQFMNFNAFHDPSIRQQLNLTPEQVRQLRTLSNNWRQQLQRFRRGAGNDLSSVDTAQWNQMWQQYGTQLNTVLTPQQQQTWSEVVGEPFTFSPDVVLGGQTSGGIGLGDTNQGVQPTTTPPYVLRTPGAGTQGAAQQGTQTRPGASRPATQGTATQGTGNQGTQGTARQGGTQGTVR